MKLRLSLLVPGVLGALLQLGGTASAQWCARMPGGGESCGFATLSQCRATVSGVGGGCFPSPGGGFSGGGRGVVAPPPGIKNRAEQRDWRKVLQERRRARLKELARERAEERAEARRAAAAAKARAAAVPPAITATNRVAIAVSEIDVNAVPTLDRGAVRRVQVLLKEKGFDPGPANGFATPRLREAVRDFQKHYGIAARGEIDNQTLLALGEVGLASQAAQ